MKNFKSNMMAGARYSVYAGAIGLAMFGHAPKHAQFSVKGVKQGVEQLFRMDSSYGLGGGLTQNLTNVLRSGVGMIVGYSSHENYVNLACNGVDPGAGASCDGPPEEGIIGKLSEFINELPSIGQSAGINRCEDVPSSGSVTGTDETGASVTIGFEQPTHSIPAGWQNEGLVFQHRVKFSVTVTGIGTPQPATIAYEFNCGEGQAQAAYAAVSMPMDNVPGWKRDIAVYNGPADATHNGIQLYMSEHDPNGSGVRTADAIDIRYEQQTLEFGLWGTLQGNVDLQNGGRNVFLKLVASGNYSTGKALVFTRAVAWEPAQNDSTNTLDPAVLSLPGISDDHAEADPQNSDMASSLSGDATVTGSQYGSPGTELREACIDFTQPDSSLPSSDASCAGFALTAPIDGAPAIDPSGSFSLNWAFTQMTGLLEDF